MLSIVFLTSGHWCRERLFDLTVTRTLALNVESTCGEYSRDQLAMVLLSNGHVPLQRVQLNRQKWRKTLSVIRARNHIIEWRVFTGKGQTNLSLVRFLSEDFLTWTYTFIELAHATFYKSCNAHNAHSISILMDLLLLFFVFSFFDSLPRFRYRDLVLRIPLALIFAFFDALLLRFRGKERRNGRFPSIFR